MHILFIFKNEILQPIALNFFRQQVGISWFVRDKSLTQPFNWQHQGTEELAHLEMVGTIVHQLTRNASIEEVEAGGLAPYYTDHGLGVYPQAASGTPFSASVLAVKGDPIADLQEDLAAEQKARATYEKLIDLCIDYPDVVDPLKFLREREIVHFQRFGEALRGVQDKLAQRKFYMNSNNPIFTNNQDNTYTPNMTINIGMNKNNCGCGR